MRCCLALACALLCALALAHTSPSAQAPSVVKGRVTDPSGAPVEGAQVQLRDKTTGTVWTTQTQEGGAYAFRVPPGRYDVVVTVPGFKDFILSDVALGSGEPKAVDVPLTVGLNISDVVTIEDTEDDMERSAELTWNAWAEPASPSPSPSFNPVRTLDPGRKNYKFVLDLAGLAYRGGPGVFSRSAAARLRDWILSTRLHTAEIKLLVIPDEKYFEPLAPAERVPTVRVNLDGVRRVLKEGLKVGRDEFEVLRANPDPDFKFGRVTLNLRTRGREGTGTVAVALWDTDGIPVDEFSVPLCVAKDESQASAVCENADDRHDWLAGTDFLRAAAQGHAFGVRPDAALHFIQLDGRTSVGIFRDNSWPPDKYVQWNLTKNAEGVLSTLERTLLPNFDQAVDDAGLKQVGTELYKLLFPLPDAEEARAAFADFLRAHAKEADTDDPPSIFVRMLPNTNDPPFLIPLGLMVYDLDGQKDFLGFNYRIQMPLPVQDYRADSRCISKWVVLAPPEGAGGTPKELNDAVGGFSDWFTKWKIEPIGEILKFGEWIGDGKAEEDSVALFLLSHHAANSLYFAEQTKVSASAIERRFKTPSLAVVNGCGTGAPGASEVVQKLNERGISGIIATSVKAEGFLAGDFFSVLGRTLAADHKGQRYPIGLAHFRALRELRTAAPRDPEARERVPYGAKVLAYQMLGNSELTVCPRPADKADK